MMQKFTKIVPTNAKRKVQEIVFSTGLIKNFNKNYQE